jgi:anthranilate phosphoribosyltransferase
VPGPDELQAALADGYVRAATAIDSGVADATLQRWVAESSRLAAERS